MLYVVFYKYSAATHIYTLSLHDLFRSSTQCRGNGRHSLMIMECAGWGAVPVQGGLDGAAGRSEETRLNCSHSSMSYAVFCVKKEKGGSEKVLTAQNIGILLRTLWMIDG